MIHSGDSVIYHYQIRNSGDTYLSDVQIMDNQYGPTHTIIGLMAPGVTKTCNKAATLITRLANMGTAPSADIPNLADDLCINLSLNTNHDGIPNCQDNDADGDGTPKHRDLTRMATARLTAQSPLVPSPRRSATPVCRLGSTRCTT